MNIKTILAVVVGIFMITASCGDSNFSGNTGRGSADADKTGKITGDDPYGKTGDGPTGDEIVVIPGDDLNDDDKAMNKCLMKFGRHPFGQNQVMNYRKINTSVSVLGFGSGIVDDQISNGPELILISAAVNVLGEQTYQLLNPNGFYCLKVDVNVSASTRIDLHCNASLADSKVNVNVMSDSTTTGVVGVHVLSDVSVRRVGGNCKN